MKKTVLMGLMLMLLASGALVFRTTTCSSCQEGYKRFLYSETLKNSPVIHTQEDIDRIIGTKPAGCTRPTSLTDEDIALSDRRTSAPTTSSTRCEKRGQRSSTQPDPGGPS